MNLFFKRTISFFLIAVMLFSILPAQAAGAMIQHASELFSNVTEYSQEDTDIIAEGRKWVLTSDGTLTLSGNVTIYTSDGAPWYRYREQILRVVLEEGVTGLGQFIFHSCTNLREVVGMERVQFIEKQVFFDCHALESIHIPEGVTVIGANAFSNCSSLTEVTLPGTLTEIQKWAFAACGFETIAIPDSVVTFGEGAFSNNRVLKTLEISDHVTEIPGYFLCGCWSLESFTIPEGVTSIGELAFFEDYALTELILPPGLTYAGKATTGQCSSLTSLTIPGSMTHLPDAFSDVPGLQTVILEEGVESIADWALANNPNLELAYIPASVASIADTAFSNSPLVTIIGMTGSYAEEWAISMGIPFAANAMDVTRLKATVLDETGAPLQDGYEIYWYRDGETEPFATGIRVMVSDLTVGYACQIILDEYLCYSYRQPHRISVNPESDGNVEFHLEAIPTINVTGQVTDPQGKPIQSSVHLIERFDNGYTRDNWFDTDENGFYSREVSDVPLDAVFSASDYRNTNVTLRSTPGGEGALPAVTLYPASTMDVIHMEITVREAVPSGEQTENQSHPSPSNLSFHVYNNTREAEVRILSFENGKLYFDPNDATSWDNLTITLTDRTGLYQSVSVNTTLNHYRVANVWATLYQLGSLQLNPLSEKAALVLVFDESGKQVDAKVTDSNYASPSLNAGRYQVAVMEQNPFLRSVNHIEQLAKIGLEDGRDYLLQSVWISDGCISDLGNLSVPVLEIQRLCHTDPALTRVAINLAETSVGQHVLVQIRYALEDLYADIADGQTVEIELPQGLQFVPGAISFNGMEADCEQTERTLNIYTNASSGVISFYVLATDVGTHTVNASLRWLDGDTEFLEPLGSAVVHADDATINGFEHTARDSVMLTGNALVGCLVQIYEGEEILAETIVNAAGRWKVDCPLTHYGNYQTHDLYAVISGEALVESLVTSTKQVIYDSDFVELVSVTMYNTAEGREQASVFGYRNPTPSTYYNVQLDVYPTFTFVLEFDGDASRLYDVELTIYEVGGGTETLSAGYVPSRNAWIVTTDITDIQKVPVNVGVGYRCDPLPDTPYGIGTTEKGVEVVMDFISDYNAYLDTQLTFAEPVEGDDGSLTFDLRMEGEWESMGKYRFEDMDYANFANLDLADEGFEPLADSSAWYTMHVEDGNLELWLVDPEVQSAGKLVADLNTGEIEQAAYTLASVRPAATGANLWLRFGEELPYPVAPSILGLIDSIDLNNLLGKRSKEFHNLRPEHYLYAVCPDGSQKLSDTELDHYFDQMAKLWSEEREQWNRLFNAINVEYRTKLGNAIILDVATFGFGKVFKAASKYLPSMPTVKNPLPENCKKILDNLQEKIPEQIPEAMKDNALYIFQKILDKTADQPDGTVWGELQDFFDHFDVSGQDYYHDIMQTYDDLYRRMSQLVSDITRDWDNCEPPKDDPHPVGPSEPKRYGIDPAGFVYEAVPSNRLPGVTVTVCYQEDEEIGPDSAVKWDAENYDQQNPLITDANGEYAWYVPFGMWQVKAELPGYETGYSDWLPVPPPQMEVHIGLVSTAVPAVEEVEVYSDSALLVFSQYMDPDSVYAGVTLTENGEPVSIHIEAMNAEYDLAGENQYATRFRLTPEQGNFEGSVQIAVSADVRNYADRAMDESYTSPEIRPVVKPEELNMRQLYSVVVGQTLNVNVTLLPAAANQTLIISTGNGSFLNLLQTTAITDSEGNATFPVEALLPGTGYLTVTEPVTGLSYTAQVNITAEEPEFVGSVTAVLEDGTEISDETTVSLGTQIWLTTDTPNAEIRYTTDGTCPCRNGALVYDEPIVIEEDTLLMAAAVVDGVFGQIRTFQITLAQLENPFVDVQEDAWYFQSVLWAVENKITSGTSATTFAPNATCTRAQVVTFLWRAMGQPEPVSYENPFSDVVEEDYFYKAVLWAVENGITSGTGNGQFSPNRSCTRDQVVTFLWRTMGEPTPINGDNPFLDVSQGVYYYQPVLWAVEQGITSGTSPTTFAPSDPCTRSQVVTFLYRTMTDH